MKEKVKKIEFNSPVVLTFVFICLGALVLSSLTDGYTNELLFSVYRGSLTDPFFYIRLVGHVFGHANWTHFFNNALYLLILGPMLEEKYGAKNMVEIIVLTAVVTGLVSVVFMGNVALLGASGVVFAMILLSSITSVKDGGIPLTFILVAVIYLGGQVIDGLTLRDNVSNLTHIIGGIVGAGCGMVLNKKG